METNIDITKERPTKRRSSRTRQPMHYIQFSPSLVRSPDAHGELDSPAPEACGYEGTPARLLLRVTLPQFPALPDLTCARGTALLFDTLSACESAKDVVGVAAEGVDGEEKSRSTSVPLKECLALGVVALVLLRRCWLYPTISMRALLCRPKSGPAVRGTTGDFTGVCSELESIKALLAKVGYADLFCFVILLRADVSTRSEPVGGRELKKLPKGGDASTGVASPLRWMR